MSFIDTVKNTLKATVDAVTGHSAIVELETEGKPGPGAIIEVKMIVTSTGLALDSKAAFVDVHGEDDLDESALERMREFLMDRDPTFTFEVHGPFLVAAEGKTYLSGRFIMPNGIDMKRIWLVRGRIQHTGQDPHSQYRLIE
jgi:hypothetical protein